MRSGYARETAAQRHGAGCAQKTFIHWGAGSGAPIRVLADSPTEALPGQKSLRLVSDAAFPEGTISPGLLRRAGHTGWPR
jgi:hypothetical protein